MERPTLYKKEKLTLKFIKEYMFEHQTAPSLEEIKTHLGKKSLATIHKSLGQLEEKGYLKRDKSHGRSITLTELAYEYFGLKPLNSLPLMGLVKAGSEGVINFDNPEAYVEVTEAVKKNDRYVLKVQGTSMIDAFINEDDYVIVEKVPDLPVRQIAIVLLNGNALIKEVLRRSDGQVILRSANPDYDDIYVKETDDFKVEGKIVQVIRNYK
jgi:repressor LexA